MQRLLQTTAAIAVLLGSAGATEIVFTDMNASGRTITTEAGGQSVDVTAASWTRTSYDEETASGTGSVDPYGPDFEIFGYESDGPAFLKANEHGLQVYSSILDENHQIDGRWGRDLVVLDFEKAVTLSSISFNPHYVDDWDDFVLFAGDSVEDLVFFDLYDVLNPSVALEVTGMTFGIGAFDKFDAFKITSIGFEDAGPVPVPGAAALMLTGLGAAGVARRRRKA